MKYLKLPFTIFISILSITTLFSQDALHTVVTDATYEADCQNGMIDLTIYSSINSGYPPFDVTYEYPDGTEFTISGVSGEDGQEDMYNLPDGIYIITVTDVLCGVAETSATIRCDRCEALILGIAHNGFIPCEGETGTLEVVLTENGYPPYNILWSNGESTNEITNLEAGTYSVTVTDDIQCLNTQTIDLHIVNPAIILSEGSGLMVTHSSNTNSPNGSITFEPSLGNGYEYNWSGPDNYSSTDANIAGLSEGEYCVEVRSVEDLDCIYASGCVEVLQDDCEDSFDLFFLNVKRPTHHTDDTFCEDENVLSQDNGSISVGVNPPGPGYTYNWSTGESTSTINNLNQGFYSLTVTDQNGCTKVIGTHLRACITLIREDSGFEQYCIPHPLFPPTTSQIEVDLIEKVNVSNNNLCGGSIDVSYLLPPDLFNYTPYWNGPNGFFSLSEDISGLCAGIYCLTVYNGCQTPREYCFEIINCDEDPIDISGEITNTCQDEAFGEIHLDISGGSPQYTYLWSNGASSASLSQLTKGHYGVTVQDSEFCSQEATFYVDDNTETLELHNGNCIFQSTCNGNIISDSEREGNLITEYDDLECILNRTCEDSFFESGSEELAPEQLATIIESTGEYIEGCLVYRWICLGPDNLDNTGDESILSNLTPIPERSQILSDTGDPCLECFSATVCQYGHLDALIPGIGAELDHVVNQTDEFVNLGIDDLDSQCAQEGFCSMSIGCEFMQFQDGQIPVMAVECLDPDICDRNPLPDLNLEDVFPICTFPSDADFIEALPFIPQDTTVAENREKIVNEKIIRNYKGMSSNSFKVYPNPTENDFLIETIDIDVSQISEILVIDSKGRLISNSHWQENEITKTINLSNQESGLILVLIKFLDGNFVTKKIIKI